MSSRPDETLLDTIERLRAPDGAAQAALDAARAAGGLAGKKVLEQGCGRGVFLAECRRRGAAVWGLETDPWLAAEARRIFDIPLADEAAPPDGFDWVFSFHELDRHEDPVAFLRGQREWLAPGGRVWLSTANDAGGSRAASLERWLVAAGLTPLSVHPIEPVGDVERARRWLRDVAPLRWAWDKARRLTPLRRLKERAFGDRAPSRPAEAAPAQPRQGATLVALAVRPLRHDSGFPKPGRA